MQSKTPIINLLEQAIIKAGYTGEAKQNMMRIVWAVNDLPSPSRNYFFAKARENIGKAERVSEPTKHELSVMVEKIETTLDNEKKKKEKPHLSFSQISMFLRCPAQWEFRYVQKLKIPPAAAMILGSSWHETIEQNYVQKIDSDEDLPLESMIDFFSDIWTKKLQGEEINFGDDEPGKLKDLGVLITDVHHREIAPKVKPALVEEEFHISLGDDFPYDLLGYFDVIERDGTIADNKSWGKTKSQATVDKDLQLSAYALGYRIKYGKVEKGLRFDAVIKNKKPKALQLLTTRTNEDCRWFLKLIEQVTDGIAKEAFFCNPNNYLCSKKWCGYWDKCKKGAK